MTTFWLKIIAIATMLIDHIGQLLFLNHKYIVTKFSISYDVLNNVLDIMRGIGRLAFPIFAFLLVVGFTHTHNRKKYFSNLLIFGIISQIPYALLNSNIHPIRDGAKNVFIFDPNDIEVLFYIIISLYIMVCIFCYHKFISHKFKDKGMIILICALAIPLLNYVTFGYVTFLGGTNSVFYTLAFGLYACYCYEKFIPLKKRPISDYLLLLPLALTLAGIGLQFDYGMLGIALIVALFAFKKHKPIQALIVFLWGFLTYNQFNIHIGFTVHLWPTLGIALAALMVLIYNNKKGYNIKWFFYTFYPAHLLVLGIINVTWLLKS